jgi:hypothetical protein
MRAAYHARTKDSDLHLFCPFPLTKILTRDEQIVKLSISHGLMAPFQWTIIKIG